MGRVSDAKERLMDAVRDLIWSGSYGSTTIDQICERAGVKKGSFYYFFDSKADVAVTAIDAEWQRRRPELDALFSPTIPPLERLKRYCDYGRKFQVEIKAKFGCVLGCPLFTLGAEVSTQEDKLQKKIQEKNTYQTTENVCETVYDSHTEDTGKYRVRYRLDGKEGVVTMDHDPGKRIAVKDGALVLKDS